MFVVLKNVHQLFRHTVATESYLLPPLPPPMRSPSPEGSDECSIESGNGELEGAPASRESRFDATVTVAMLQGLVVPRAAKMIAYMTRGCRMLGTHVS